MEYGKDLESNLQSLLDRAKSGTYFAPPVRRVHIPKGTGKEIRPIGIPATEDIVKVLNNDKDDDVQANVVAFGLDGAKILIEEDSFEVEPLSSGFAVLDVGGTVEFEVQVKLDGKAADKSLRGGFGKDENTEWLGSFHHTTHGRDVPGYPHFVQSRAHSLLILQGLRK